MSQRLLPQHNHPDGDGSPLHSRHHPHLRHQPMDGELLHHQPLAGLSQPHQVVGVKRHRHRQTVGEVEAATTTITTIPALTAVIQDLGVQVGTDGTLRVLIDTVTIGIVGTFTHQ